MTCCQAMLQTRNFAGNKEPPIAFPTLRSRVHASGPKQPFAAFSARVRYWQRYYLGFCVAPLPVFSASLQWSSNQPANVSKETLQQVCLLSLKRVGCPSDQDKYIRSEGQWSGRQRPTKDMKGSGLAVEDTLTSLLTDAE